jgi:hypothetical protein
MNLFPTTTNYISPFTPPPLQIIDIIVRWLTRSDECLKIDPVDPDESISDYHQLPDTEALAETVRGCLQESDEVRFRFIITPLDSHSHQSIHTSGTAIHTACFTCTHTSPFTPAPHLPAHTVLSHFCL